MIGSSFTLVSQSNLLRRGQPCKATATIYHRINNGEDDSGAFVDVRISFGEVRNVLGG